LLGKRGKSKIKKRSSECCNRCIETTASQPSSLPHSFIVKKQKQRQQNKKKSIKLYNVLLFALTPPSSHPNPTPSLLSHDCGRVELHKLSYDVAEKLNSIKIFIYFLLN
jgi:hypothetical protein